MANPIKVALAGAGAFGLRHLDAINEIDGVEAVSLVGRDLDKTKEVGGETRRRPRHDRSRRDPRSCPASTPSYLQRPLKCTRPRRCGASRPASMCRSRFRSPTASADAEAVVAMQKRDGPGRHGRPHAPLQSRATSGCTSGSGGRVHIQQMDVQTYFFRRTNMNALGQPRSWTDHLLWHHAAHTVDLFAYQTGAPIVKPTRCRGRSIPTLGIAMDMSDPAQGGQRRHLHPVAVVQQRRARSARSSATSATRRPTSPATTISSPARTRRSTSRKVDVSMNGIELQDREFFAAIREGREPNASVAPGAALLPGPGRTGKANGLACATGPGSGPFGARVCDPRRLSRHSLARQRMPA